MIKKQSIPIKPLQHTSLDLHYIRLTYINDLMVKTKMYTTTIAIQHSARRSSQYNKARKGRHVDKGKENMKVSLCQIT